jgi:hypothetical protein
LKHRLNSQLFKGFCFLLEVLDLTPIKSERQLYDVGYKSNQTMHYMVRVDILLGTITLPVVPVHV